MEEQQPCYITSVVALQPTLLNRHISFISDTDSPNSYSLKVNASHGNIIQIQPGKSTIRAGKSTVNYFDVSRIVFDPAIQPFYWHNVRTFIEATLIGYHGMIIFIQSSHVQLDKISISPIQILYKAIDQIFYCISHSKCKHTQLFQVLFSHYALPIEGGHVFDLCRGLDPAAHLFRYVQGRQQKLIKTSISNLDDLKQLISRNYENFLSELPQGSAETNNLAKLGYHEFMFINVGFTGFSASFAPIGGELTFVTLSTDYLSASTNTGTNIGTLDVRSISLLTARTIDPLKHLLDNFDSDNVSDQIPLCAMLRDGIGGPCKTCVITIVPDNFVLSEIENESANEIRHLLGIAEKFARVKNCPNRRVFAEKALMNIYMQEIHAQSDSYALDYPPQSEEGDTGDSVQQAAIALQDAVMEYNKRSQSADGEECDSEDVSKTDGPSTENTDVFVEESIIADMIPSRRIRKPIIADNMSEVKKTASPDLQMMNEVTRVTDDNTDNSIPNRETTHTNIAPVYLSPGNIRCTDSGNSFGSSVTDNRTVGDNCKIPSDVSGDLLYERMDLHSSKRESTFDETGINSENVMQVRIKGILQLDDNSRFSKTYSDKDVSNENETADQLLSPLRFGDSHDAKIAEVVSYMLQDPHKGAPRCFEARGNNQILQRRDLGSIFTGEVITTWIKENIDGMSDFDNAEMFGQWLLDQGVLIHSEGSGVFAAAASLFYYARRSKPSTGKLSLEEIRRLMLEANKVLQPANTEFYDPTDKALNNNTGDNVVYDDMIYHQLMAEQHIVIQTANCNVGMEDNSLTEKQTNAAINESSANSLTVSVNRSSNVRKFYWNQSKSSNTELEDGAAPNKISEMFQTLDVVVAKESNESSEEVKPVKKDVLVGNLTEKYVENIVQVDLLHPLFENSRNGCRMGVLKNLVLTFGVNFEDEQIRTAMFYAAAGDQGRIGLELIHSHANINHTDRCKLTPLLVATQLGHVSFMSMLLSSGADVTMYDDSGSNAYHLACKLEATGCLVKLMKKAKSDVLNKLDNSGFTPLHYAIRNKFPVHLEMLLKCNIDTTVIDPRGLSYLSYAVFYQSIYCVNQLLKRYPVLLGETNADSSTPLHIAAMLPTADLMQVLLMNAKILKKHFDIHQCDNKGRSVLHAACMRGCEESVRLLLQSDFSVLVVDDAGGNPLKYAQGNSRLSQDVIELLEAAEIDQVNGIIKLQNPGSKSCQIQ